MRREGGGTGAGLLHCFGVKTETVGAGVGCCPHCSVFNSWTGLSVCWFYWNLWTLFLLDVTDFTGSLWFDPLCSLHGC